MAQFQQAAKSGGRAFQPTALQVLFTLLCNPEMINRPYRELAAMAGVAHGTVGWVMADLQQQGFVGDLKGKRGNPPTARAGVGVETAAAWAYVVRLLDRA